MLLNLVIEHPQALLTVAARTPVWVWGLLAALVALGASQTFARTAGLRRVLTMPIAMTGFSAWGLASAFGGAAHVGAVMAAWLISAAAVAATALRWRSAAPAGTRFDAAGQRFHLPGSPWPLALILGIFLVKYGVGVELAMQPQLAHDSRFALQIALLYGVFNGLFAARSLRLWRLALGTRPALQSA